ncbi:hypothetical protein BG011_007985 [Mortierella polycephala]|uniref:cAMP-independent regulatory protein pac2 n=1 Tax=Mortierella polycephala TaxID=41804 RepID=A0A9P6PS39_9FUNG|nr:hypothetical protein BG011_007985 [Mortierella polycephala]
MDHNSMETYFGLIKTPQDALIIFEGKFTNSCRLGLTSRVHRRLSDIERQSVRSGSVYCFDEREAGMRRWTDGKSWSPSRVTGSFLTYRELDDTHGNHNGKNVYRPNGLLKQSFSITTSENQKLHLISYYTNDDVRSERLCNTPSLDPRFGHIVIPKGVYPESVGTVEHNATSTSQSSPSPPMPNRNKRADHKTGAQHRRNGSSSSINSATSHRRTNSGSHSLRDHRYSPIQVQEKHLASRSRSNSNLAIYTSLASKNGDREQRYKSSSPSAHPVFAASNGYSPAASWVSDDDQPMITDTHVPGAMHGAIDMRSAPVMIPALRELPPLHRDYEDKLKERPSATHEQDSLSVLANLATHSLLLPKLEPKEVSREKGRWVEDDRQLRALSSMLRL